MQGVSKENKTYICMIMPNILYHFFKWISTMCLYIIVIKLYYNSKVEIDESIISTQTDYMSDNYHDNIMHGNKQNVQGQVISKL